MKIKNMLLAAALAASTSSAFASIGLTENSPGHLTASFGSTPILGLFTDTFTFTPPVALGSSADVSFIHFATDVTKGGVSFSSATLNGNPFSTYYLWGGTLTGGLGSNIPVDGLLTLVISGSSNGGSYGGNIEISAPVPEPASYALMLGGLAVLAFTARRKA